MRGRNNDALRGIHTGIFLSIAEGFKPGQVRIGKIRRYGGTEPSAGGAPGRRHRVQRLLAQRRGLDGPWGRLQSCVDAAAWSEQVAGWPCPPFVDGDVECRWYARRRFRDRPRVSGPICSRPALGPGHDSLTVAILLATETFGDCSWGRKGCLVRSVTAVRRGRAVGKPGAAVQNASGLLRWPRRAASGTVPRNQLGSQTSLFPSRAIE